jgi:putative SOS response-associated peptidase YedK
LGDAATATDWWPARLHWRGWLKPENRCLVPVNSFVEYAPETNAT